MYPEINIYECFALAFQTYGYPCQTDGESFCFLPLNLHLTAIIEDITQSTETIISSRIFLTATHSELFPDGIREYGYGWGATGVESVTNAIERWIESDFPAIHDYLCTGESSKKNKMEMVSRSGETGEYLAWNIFMGPLIEISSKGIRVDEENKLEIMKLLLNSMTGDLLGRRGMYPIRSFASKNADNEIDVDCRINATNWEQGRYDLYSHANDWEVKSGLLAWKQYMLIVPVDMRDIDSEGLKNSVDEEWDKANAVSQEPVEKKKWWQFWN